MKAYLTRVLAVVAAAFSAQATITSQVEAQNPAESRAWSEALDDGTLDAFRDYLARYPVGSHSREAFARIIQLSPEPEAFGELDQTRSSVDNNQPDVAERRGPTVLDRKSGLY